MINWDKLPYSQNELKASWEHATFVNDAAKMLNLSTSIPRLRTLAKIAESIDLPAKPIWSRNFTPDEFSKAWNDSLTVQEVAKKLETTTRGFETLRLMLNLPEKTNEAKVTYSKEQFINVWEKSKYLDDVAERLNVSVSRKSLGKLLSIARSLNLDPKEKYIPTTDTGENAGDIIGSWIEWHESFFKVKPLPSTVGIAAGKTKELIGANYDEASIRWGLWQWSLKSQQGEYTSGETLFKLVTRHHAKNNPEVESNINKLRELESPDPQTSSKMKKPPVIEAKKW